MKTIGSVIVSGGRVGRQCRLMLSARVHVPAVIQQSPEHMMSLVEVHAWVFFCKRANRVSPMGHVMGPSIMNRHSCVSAMYTRLR